MFPEVAPLCHISARDRDQILVETFLTSQTGRLYLLLAAATGRL